MKKRIVYSIIAVISGALLGCSSNSDYTVDEFNEIPSLLEYYNVPGVSIAIIKDFEIEDLL